MSVNPYLLTLPELMSAKKKIGRAARFYDREKQSLKGFDSQVLNPTEFRIQLRSNFQVELTDAELGAIIFLFDKDGDGEVDSVEFISEFFRLGKAERLKFDIAHKDQIKRNQVRALKLSEEKKKKWEKLTYTRTTTKFKPEHMESALRKMSMIALSYDPNKSGGLKGFAEVGSMTPPEFQQQMKRNFQVVISPEEMAALMEVFDENNDGNIDCNEFMYHFFRIGRVERDRLSENNRIVNARKVKAMQKRKQKLLDKYGQLIVAHMTEATEADMESAERKIRKAAAFFTKIKAFSPQIEKIFESESLSPTDFREQLKTNFDITLTPGELDAAMKMFDADGDGSISCVEFLSTFFYMGAQEKSRIRQKHRGEQERIRIKEETRINNKLDAAAELVRTRVKWPVLPQEETNITKRLSISGDSEDTDGMEGLSLDSGHSNSHLPPIGSPPPTGLQIGQAKHKSRKASVIDIIAPNRQAQQLAQHCASLTNLFPKASQDTKDFIQSIESQERDIRQMKSVKKKNVVNKGKKKPISTSTTLKSWAPSQATLTEEEEPDDSERNTADTNQSNYYDSFDEQPLNDEFDSYREASADRGSSRGGSRAAQRSKLDITDEERAFEQQNDTRNNMADMFADGSEEYEDDTDM